MTAPAHCTIAMGRAQCSNNDRHEPRSIFQFIMARGFMTCEDTSTPAICPSVGIVHRATYELEWPPPFSADIFPQAKTRPVFLNLTASAWRWSCDGHIGARRWLVRVVEGRACWGFVVRDRGGGRPVILWPA